MKRYSTNRRIFDGRDVGFASEKKIWIPYDNFHFIDNINNLDLFETQRQKQMRRRRISSRAPPTDRPITRLMFAVNQSFSINVQKKDLKKLI